MNLQAHAVALRDLLQSMPAIAILEDATDEACPWLSFACPGFYAVASFTPDGFALHDDRMRPYASWSISDHSAGRVPAWLTSAIH